MLLSQVFIDIVVILIVPAFHQGGITNIDKLKRSIVLPGDIHYNTELMKEENQIKGCLIRNSGIVLCILF